MTDEEIRMKCVELAYSDSGLGLREMEYVISRAAVIEKYVKEGIGNEPR